MNYECDLIVSYIKENKETMNPEEIKFLIEFKNKMKKQNIYNESQITKEELIKDIINLKDYIADNNTSFNIKRNYLLYSLLKRVNNDDDLLEVSYLVDKLYMEYDLPIREKSAVVSKLKMEWKKTL